eukprot:3417020-Lingulodinium_polyedra.AAC.1
MPWILFCGRDAAQDLRLRGRRAPLMPSDPLLLTGAGGFSGGALLSALAHWAFRRPAAASLAPAGPHHGCEPCNSCCQE